LKVFTKEDLLMLGDGDEGLVEYEYDEAFVNSLGSFGSTELYLGDVTVPPMIPERIPDEEYDLPNYGKCTSSSLVDPQTGEVFLLVDKRFLLKDETSRLSYIDFANTEMEDGSKPFLDHDNSLVVPTFENLVDEQWMVDTRLMKAMAEAYDDDEDVGVE